MMKAIVIDGKNWGKTFGKLLIVIETSSAPPPIEVNRMSLKIQNTIYIVNAGFVIGSLNVWVFIRF